MTSLSRQLTQLQVSSTFNSDGFSPIIVKEAEFIDLPTLNSICEKNFENLLDLCPRINVYSDILFEDIDSKSIKESSSTLVDLLRTVSPFLLRKSTQWLIQLLITKHRIHIVLPETLFAISLPFYEYEIFSLILFSISEVPSKKYPNWLRIFKQACLPTTQLGLYKHLACDRGFFKQMCDTMLDIVLHVVRDPFLNCSKFAHFFAASIFGAFETCYSISEFQMHNLMQVIVDCLKSENRELRSCSSILLSFTLPKVKLSTSVVRKLLKVVKKICTNWNNEESLAVLCILYRSQINDFDACAALNLFCLHKSVIKELLSSDGDAKNLDFRMRVLDTLAELFDYLMAAPKSNNENALNIMMSDNFAILMGLIQTRNINPSLGAAQSLILNASKTYNRCKLIRSMENLDNTEKTSLKKIIILCKKILKFLREKFPAEYVYFSAVQTEESDILLISDGRDGIDDIPTAQQIAIKRFFFDSQCLLGLIMKDFLTPKSRQILRLSKDLNLGRNIDAIKLLGTSDPAFLLNQLGADVLCKVLINLISLYRRETFLISLLCCEDLLGNNEFVSVLEANKIDLFLILLESFLEDPIFDIILGSFICSQNITHTKIFNKFLGLKMLLEQCNDDGNVVRWSLVSRILSQDIASIICLILNGEIYRDPFVVYVIMMMVVKYLKADGSENNLLIAQTMLAILSQEVTQISNKEIIEIKISECNRPKLVNTIPLRIVTEFLSILQAPGYFFDLSFDLINFASQLNKLDTVCVELRDTLLQSLRCSAENEKNLENVCYSVAAMRQKNNTGTYAPQLLCLDIIFDILTEKPESVERLVSFSSINLCLLLSCVSSEHKRLRKLAFKCLHAVLVEDKDAKKKAGFFPLIQYICEHKTEIVDHPDNIATVMRNSKKQSLVVLIGTLINTTCLRLDDSYILAKIAPFFAGLKSLANISILSEYCRKLLQRRREYDMEAISIILTLFCGPILHYINDTNCFDFLENVLVENYSDLSTFTLERLLKGQHFESAPYHSRIFSLLIDVSFRCKSSQSLALLPQAVDKLVVGSSDIHNKLTDIWGERIFSKTCNSRSNKIEGREKFSERFMPHNVDQDEENWQKTYFMLEMVLKRSFTVDDAMSLLKPFFKLLQFALVTDEYYDNSYALELLLSSVHHIINELPQEQLAGLKDGQINPELIVRCIRNCKNTDTKSTALLILAKSSACNAEYVLHNSIPIFTFMGSHFLKFESKQSFEIACQAIDIIIPHIQNACLTVGGESLRQTSISIVTTFVDASIDMAGHRFKIFLHKLVQCLGEKEYLWILTLLLLKKTCHLKRTSLDDIKDGFADKQQQQLLDLFSQFSVAIQIEAIIRMMVNTQKSLTDSNELKRMLALKDNKTSQMDDQNHEYDLLRLKIMNFISCLLTSHNFIKELFIIGVGSGNDHIAYETLIEKLLICAIVNLDVYEIRNASSSSAPSKVAKYLIRLCEKILESTLSIIPCHIFVKSLGQLLRHEKDVVRKKSLEVLNIKIQAVYNDHDDGYKTSILNHSDLFQLLGPLMEIASNPDERVLNRQTALLVMRSFARCCPQSCTPQIMNACDVLVQNTFLKTLDNPNLIASALLCITELIQSIGPHGVPYLSPFVSWILLLMEQNGGQPSLLPSHGLILVNSLILSIQKLLLTFSGFLNPYFSQFVFLSSCLVAYNANMLSQRSKHLLNALSEAIPTHSLIEICQSHYDQICGRISKSKSSLIVILLDILQQNVSSLTKMRVLDLASSFVTFFLHLFKFRREGHCLDLDDILMVEEKVIDTFATMMFKLPLDDFKPLFHRIFKMVSCTNDDEILMTSLEGQICAFHMTFEVASRLKSLFVFACDTLLPRTIQVLVSLASSTSNDDEDDKTGQNVRILFVFVLKTLHQIFLYNRVESIDGIQHRYDDLVTAVVTSFEHSFRKGIDAQLVIDQIKSCLIQLGYATDDESQWKNLHYQVLLCLRSPEPKVRLCILEIIKCWVERRGQSYLSSLPDAVPFLSEVLEDDNSLVEKSCKCLVNQMEQVFGHSIESYFE